MTKREIAVLSFKVLGLYAFIRVIDHLPYILYYVWGENAKQTIVPNLLIIAVPPLLLVLCSVLLWFGAPLLASIVFKSAPSGNVSNASLPDMQTVAFAVVGLILIASALPEIVSSVVIYYTMYSVAIGGKRALIQNIIVLFLKLGLGFWLLLGSRGLVSFIRSLRRE